MVDKKDGDGNGNDNVIPFPQKKHQSDPKAIAYIVKEVMDENPGGPYKKILREKHGMVI